ncbi:MAG: GntR family transcriptional regulator [Lachnospiraceae bacterium]|nr:GntR family transcriptional regulator [Lachnospiraceae bacterium]
MDVSLNQQTYDRLKKDIMTFSLKPGEQVSASKIASRYGVSRTPAREALVRLQAEGLVDIYPQSKSMISRIKQKLIMQEWFVRKSLETGMVDDFFKGVTKEDLDLMRVCVNEQEKVGKEPRDHENSYIYLQKDDEFHQVIYRAAGKKLAARIIADMLPNYRRVRLLVDMDDVYKKRTVTDHMRLIKLVEENRKEEYRTLLSEHLGHIIDDMEYLKEKMPQIFEENGYGF